MMLVFQKRVAISLAFALLCTSATPTKADSNASYTAGMACIIAAGVVGLCGLVYGLVQACKQKSNEQIADDAEKAYNAAHQEGRRFYSEYMNVFMRACRAEPTLDDIECNFLEVVAHRMYTQGIGVEEHIYMLEKSISSLKKALEEVKGAAKSLLRSRNRVPLYNRLVKIEHDIESELGYLRDYHQCFANHRAYFVLAAFESKLRARYMHEFALADYYSTASYQFEHQLLHAARTYHAHSAYPLVSYYAQLCSDIATLEWYIRDLKHWYPKRVGLANQLLGYLVPMRNVIANTFAFKEERERKKEDDAHRELLALRRREVEAQEAKARAEAQRALAAQQQAIAAQQQAAAARQQQTVVVVQQQVVQQAPATQQQSTQQSTATNQTNGTNSNAQTITVGQGNNQRQVSVAWYEQNKPGAVDSGVQ
jgi:hypothetical protein